MPRSVHTEGMRQFRAATLELLHKTIRQAIEADNTNAVYLKQIRDLLDLYIGTLPSSYRGENE